MYIGMLGPLVSMIYVYLFIYVNGISFGMVYWNHHQIIILLG